MNSSTLNLIAGAFSMKREIKLVFFTVGIICLIPIFIVIILTQAGFNVVSDALASSDPQTNEVQIHNPANGDVIQTVTTPRVWPATGVVTLEFGAPNLPYYLFHTGIDIAHPQGLPGVTPVVAFMDGHVKSVIYDEDGYGYHVVIEHTNYLSTTYAHLDSISVLPDTDVLMGTPLGMMGDTGMSSGPHLHFETRVFHLPVNPRIFLSGNPNR
jgi:murein DD-endopeptidase MepM/ murein hydrolase activator NlpD